MLSVFNNKLQLASHLLCRTCLVAIVITELCRRCVSLSPFVYSGPVQGVSRRCRVVRTGRGLCFDCVMNVIVILIVFALSSHHHLFLPLSIFNPRTKGSLVAASVSAYQTLTHLGFKGPMSLWLSEGEVANNPEFVLIMAKAEGGKEPVNEQAVANMYAAMRSELNQIYSKITELEMEVSEHTLVTNAIQPLDQSRRCYRMIGGVLVERTIKEVLPAVQRNKEGLEEVVARLNEALEKKKKEISEFEAKYKIRIRKADAEVKDESGRKEGSAQGVLVGPAGGSE
ncbi:putative prefoldin subunit 2 [Glycine max]|nr:putative prefoldin subunit 2 [Glycine max]